MNKERYYAKWNKAPQDTSDGGPCECVGDAMTDGPHETFRPQSGEPPNPLDFPVKDPLKETYEGRWQQLPVIQKIGVIVFLGFWCVFITVLVWDNGKVQYLNTALVFAIVTTILGAFFLLLKRHIR